MGLCFEDADKEIITGNVIIFCGSVCVGLFIYIQYQLLYKNPLFCSSIPLSCFADAWEWQVAMHNRTDKALAAVLCPRCNITLSAVAIVLYKDLAPT